LISITQKGLKKLSTKRTNNPNNKWTSELNSHFSNEEVQVADKYMKKMFNNLDIREMQIKTTLRFHFTLVIMASIKKTIVTGITGSCLQS
jgi:hypothetical protein